MRTIGSLGGVEYRPTRRATPTRQPVEASLRRAIDRRGVATVLMLTVALTGQVARASETSERLYSRGLVEFHAGRFRSALPLFEQAVQADPADAYALYYRGVTRGRLNDLTGAIDDLRTALVRKPDFQQAALELGSALVEAAAYQEAIPWLEQAQRAPDLDAPASLFLGIAQLRLGRLADARRNFQRAEADPGQRLTARYYQGLVSYLEGKWPDARAHFTFVASSSPDSQVGKEAAAFLQKMRQGEIATKYRVNGRIGIQYDSNVALAPSDDLIKNQVGISQQGDGRVSLEAGGVYVLWRDKRTQLSIGYNFFQSLHFTLTDFNLQDHEPAVQLTHDAGPVQFGLLGRYDYYLLETDSFLQEAAALPWVTVPMGTVGRAEVLYRMRWRNFYQQPYSDLNNGLNQAAGFRQYFYVGAPDRYLWVSYIFDHERALNSEGRLFAYDGHTGEGGIGWPFPAAITAEASFSYTHEDYAPESNGRQDDEYQLTLVIRKPLTEYLALMAGYFGTINNSTDNAFEYDRHIGSLALEVGF